MNDATMANPAVTYVGPVAVWWIPKRRGPRVSLWTVMFCWLIGLPIVAGTMLWNWAHSQPLWPFGRQVSAEEIVLRYEYIVLTYLAYVTLRSLPGWIRFRTLARADAAAIDAAIQGQQWEAAALLVHRYCLLITAIWRRVPARVATWDALLRPRLPRHRRLYVYYRERRGGRPEIPPDATSSFTPAIIPPPHPPLWSALGLIPVVYLLYKLVGDILKNGYWQRVLLFNAVLLALILISYGVYFFAALLGRSHFFRFAPGAVQLVKFTLFRRRPLIETFNLRESGAVLDLSWSSPGMTLMDARSTRRATFRLPRGQEVRDAFFRAVLSAAPTPPLPEEQLMG